MPGITATDKNHKAFPRLALKPPIPSQHAQLRSERQFCLNVVLLGGCTLFYVKSTCSVLSRLHILTSFWVCAKQLVRYSVHRSGYRYAQEQQS